MQAERDNFSTRPPPSCAGRHTNLHSLLTLHTVLDVPSQVLMGELLPCLRLGNFAAYQSQFCSIKHTQTTNAHENTQGKRLPLPLTIHICHTSSASTPHRQGPCRKRTWSDVHGNMGSPCDEVVQGSEGGARLWGLLLLYANPGRRPTTGSTTGGSRGACS